MKIKPIGKALKWILGDSVRAITLAPFGIYIDEKYLDHWYREELVRHETIHWKQQMEMLILPFYIWYIVEWFIKLITPPVGAYRDISFEREGYLHKKDVNYLENRKHFAWFKYIRYDVD